MPQSDLWLKMGKYFSLVPTHFEDPAQNLRYVSGGRWAKGSPPALFIVQFVCLFVFAVFPYSFSLLYVVFLFVVFPLNGSIILISDVSLYLIWGTLLK